MCLSCFRKKTEDATGLDKINKLIDRQIDTDKKKDIKEYKLLLLGTGEAGKSTFLRQMKIIHMQGFSEDEKKNFIILIRQNILMAIIAIYKTMNILMTLSITDKIASKNGSLQQQLSNPLIKNYMENEYNSDYPDFHKFIDDLKKIHDDDKYNPEELINLLEAIGNKNFYIKSIKIATLFDLPDSAQYYLEKDNLKRILSKEYIPTDDDILRSRSATSGINEITFIQKQINFRVVDVGGQRSERRKWIYCFDSVTAIMFLASLSEYDQYLVENPTINRTKESLSLFTTILNYEIFNKTSILLFLNKTDLAEKKIIYSNVKEYFPTYNGNPTDFVAFKKYFLAMYNACNNDSARIIYVHYTCATDTKNIKFVFEAVKDLLLQSNLELYSLA